MLKNFVCETSNAPGNATTINLGGAQTGRNSFAGAGFTNGALCWYGMDDGVQFEWGVGTFATGSPNTLSRTTVRGNSAGNTSRLTFNSSATLVYCELPAENTIYSDQTGLTTLPGGLSVPSGATTLSPANANVTISPSGSGRLISNGATTGSIDNVNIGQSVPRAIQGTTIGATTDLYVTGVVALVPGSSVQNGWGVSPSGPPAAFGPGTVGYVASFQGNVLGGAYFSVSDERAKDDRQELAADRAVDWVMRTTAMEYTMDGAPGIGFIAQDQVRIGWERSVIVTEDETMEERVHEDGFVSRAGVRLNLNYSTYVPVLQSALRETRRELAAMTARVLEIEARLAGATQ